VDRAIELSTQSDNNCRNLNLAILSCDSLDNRSGLLLVLLIPGRS
jgi:hypothetical protein